jgi:putative acetyltransferase
MRLADIYWRVFDFVARRLIAVWFMLGGTVLVFYFLPSLLDPNGTILVNGKPDSDFGMRLIAVLFPGIFVAVGVFLLFFCKPLVPKRPFGDWAETLKTKIADLDRRPGGTGHTHEKTLTLIVRAESANDILAIEKVTKAAFLAAPHASGTEARIIDGLRKRGALARSLVAVAGHEVVGHVALSPVAISDGASGWYGLGPISVLPEYQKRGIGTHLVNEAMKALRAVGASGCVLVGEVKFYSRFGFRTDERLTYPGLPPEYFLILPFSETVPRGVVSYDEAFNVA